MSTTFEQLVWALKFAVAVAKFSPAVFKNCWIPTDLPTPVSPEKITLSPPA
jgi:hypothetical protein